MGNFTEVNHLKSFDSSNFWRNRPPGLHFFWVLLEETFRLEFDQVLIGMFS